MEREMRIVSLNCWCGRAPGLVDWLLEVNADVYCLQEVTSPLEDAPEQVYFSYKHYKGREERAQSPRVLQQIADRLVGYQQFFFPRAEYEVFDEGGRPYRIQYGNALFIRDGIPILAMRSEFVYGQYWEELGDPPIPANAQAVRLRWSEKSRDIVVAQFHGAWDPAGKGDSPARDEQFKNLQKLVIEMMVGNSWAVVCGDFNILPQSAYLRSFERMGFTELVEAGNFNGTRTSYYKRRPDTQPPYFADYMLVNQRVVVDTFDVVSSPEISDHCPLVLDIK
jgi:endonuclease/exonuclease/phosphatase family metal-dependent hydrolase